MDYAYSPIQDINTYQRINKPKKIKPQLKGKRIIKSESNNEKIIRYKNNSIL